MGLENYYLKLPDFIKYNPRILKLSFDITDKINTSTGVPTQDFLSQRTSDDGELKLTEVHRKFHVLYVELLIFIDKICRKHDIVYWVGFGTLLGAVRHGGFIPWDDDIDLGLLRKDYNKLIEVLPKEILENGLKESCGLTLLMENKKNYFKEFNNAYDVRNRDGNPLVDGKYSFLQFAWMKPFLKIDLFPFDFIEDDMVDGIQERFSPAMYKFHNDLLNNRIRYMDEIDVVRRKVGFTDLKTKKFSESVEGVPHWRIKMFDYDKTFPLSMIEFEGHEFPCPKDCNHYLISMYGPNYMDYPDVIYNHDTLKLIETQFESKEDMENAFDEAIDFLKNINDNLGK